MSEEEVVKIASDLREEKSILRGIVLGLLLWIFGNLFASHYYAMVSEGITSLFGEAMVILGEFAINMGLVCCCLLFCSFNL